MLQPLNAPPAGLRGNVTVAAVRGSTVAMHHEVGAPEAGAEFLGLLHGVGLWAVDADAHGALGPDIDDDLPYLDLFTLHTRADEATWFAAGRAVQIIEWSRTHRFCGRCATETVSSGAHERAKKCPACGLLAFPRLAPAIIVLVTDDQNRALLARGATFSMPLYSCLAGFVEAGENMEEAVAREVREEVGIEVRDIRYIASQPWPFPHSLMLGFTARYAGGDLVLDEKEILDANWYTPDALPNIPPRISIARRLIDSWVAASD